MSSTEQIIHDLLLNQMEEFAIQIVTHFPNIDTDRIMQITLEHCNSIHFGDFSPYISKKYNDKKCMARVWRTGSGNEQCLKNPRSGDYCTKHAKEAMETDQPCQVNQDGKKRGLFKGRIDKYQDNREGIPPYKDHNNILRIEWNLPKMKHIVSTELENGISTLCSCNINGCAWCENSYYNHRKIKKSINTKLLTPSFFMTKSNINYILDI